MELSPGHSLGPKVGGVEKEHNDEPLFFELQAAEQSQLLL